MTTTTPQGTPSAGQAETFACPQCAAGYKWKPELEGRKIRCKHCQTVFSPAIASAVAAAGARSGFAMLAQPRARVATEEDELGAIQNWVIPLVVLGLGLAWRIWQASAHAGRFESVALWQSLGLVLAEWIAVTIAVAGGIVASSMFLEVDYERPWIGMLKAASTAILMCAVAQFCSSFDQAPEDLWGMIQGVPLVLLLAFFMLAIVFGADLLEALMSSVIITIFVVCIMAAMAFLMRTELGTVLSFGRPA